MYISDCNLPSHTQLLYGIDNTSFKGTLFQVKSNSHSIQHHHHNVLTNLRTYTSIGGTYVPHTAGWEGVQRWHEAVLQEAWRGRGHMWWFQSSNGRYLYVIIIIIIIILVLFQSTLSLFFLHKLVSEWMRSASFHFTSFHFYPHNTTLFYFSSLCSTPLYSTLPPIFRSQKKLHVFIPVPLLLKSVQ